MGQPFPQALEQGSGPGQVLVPIATEVTARLGLALTDDEVQAQAPVADAPGLTEAIAVEADEIRILPLQVAEQDLLPAQFLAQAVAEGEKGRVPHSPPPKTSTARNRAGGEAWPTWMD